MTKYRRLSMSNAQRTSRLWTRMKRAALEIFRKPRGSATKRSSTSRNALLPTLALLMLCGCASQPSVVYVPSPPPQVPPPSAGITSPIQRDFLSRIDDFLSGRPLQPREMETSSKPAEGTTKQ